MLRKVGLLVFVVVLSLVVAVPAFAEAPGGRPGSVVVVYVRSQELYYDSIVTTPLPPHGPFQLLEKGLDDRLETDFGPGDQGYVGGRWMADLDGNGVVDYFSCPLLGPGRTTP
jgi:hypothetical protein